jgi:hypothetical protein
MNTKKTLALFLAVLFLLPLLSDCLEIQLRLSSGLRRMKLDEPNLVLAGWGERIRREASLQPNWSLESGDISPLHFGFSFEGELTVFLASRLAVGINAGYIYRELNEQATLFSVSKVDATYNYAKPTEVSAYPLTFLGYLFSPLGSKFHIYFKGGGGIIQAKYIDREAVKKADEAKFSYPALALAEARGSTYLGGIGLDYKFDPSIGFFIEATAQSAKVSGFSGKNTLGEKGNLYFFEEYAPQLDFWQAKMQVLPQEPAGENIRSVREATADFSGFSVKIGLLLKF